MSKEITFFLHKFAPVKALKIEAYTPNRKAEWDAFVDASRNGTFLLRRDYMDYHSDRFSDCSLIVWRDDKITALLPASAHGTEVRSHGGLTYGGLIFGYASDFSATAAIEIFNLIVAHYKASGFKSMIYKPIPHIYHKYPSEDDLYAVFRVGGQIEECNISSTIDLSCAIRFNEGSRGHIRKCGKLGITVSEESDFGDFWEILSTLLRERYGTAPVHTLEEITRLRNSFPDNIRLFCAREADGKAVGGVVVYDCGVCVHSQYTAASEKGKRLGVLAQIYDHIISQACSKARYFDFGSCNEEHGHYLNDGLLAQKNGMGGRGIAYQIYRIDF